MEEEENMSPPFWLQASNSFRQSNHRSSRLGRSASSVFFSSGAFVFALIVIVLVFIFFVIPSLLPFTSQIFRPYLVKKSWDSLNLVLVLFAIVCGFLSRNSCNDNNVSSPMSYDVSSPQKFEKSNPSTPRQWYDQYSDRSRTVDNQSSGATSTMDRGVRTSSSYPDLRQQEPSWNVVRDERWRSHDDTQVADDTHVADYRIPGSDPQHQLHRPHRSWHEEPAEVLAHEEPAEVLAHEEPAEVQARVGCVLRTQNIPVNTFVIPAEQVSSSHARIQVIQPDPLSSSHAQIQVIQSDPLSSSHAQIQVIQSNSPPPSPPRTQTPPPPPPPRKTKRTYQAIGEKENSNASDNFEVENNLPPPPPQAPPSPPLPPPSSPPQMSKEVENKKTPAGKHAKKKGVATTKEFLITSLRKSRKKQRQRSVENFETLLASASSAPSSALPPPSPPPPPPPLPPPSVFHNLFSSKKSNKPKKTIHPIPQPPSPPPLPRINSTGRLSQIRPTMTTQKPLPPVKVTSFINRDDENANSGGESPSVGIPPPPPLPPFSIPVTKYAEHGDFVRIKSNDSSLSGSPDLDDSDQDSVPSPTMEAGSKTPSEGGESPTNPMFCPSPDVNTKADTFIATFRASLKLEKMNSARGRSNLGPHSIEEDVTDI
ncbi:ras-associated and pleckstrin y domains-containing protein 1-like [Pyrus ussuriensis x Pyrus communis]|uniref:Ras-associated and pleckstrin y domains-containing protein 1-like n=1 Tax=Pyrus ussuriensis x Pyrus communis TaxID=2448454 RepID=A0A5N5H205_9ROSA|nr:ras-associated and pleckstrin y domains-containing protein 1-like [Pyrus ussuriensis x Pyrus communis]